MIMDLCIKQAISKQTSKILVKLMIWGVIHHTKAISEQGSKFLCNTDVYWAMHQIRAISEQSSEILCDTDIYGVYIKTKQFRNGVLVSL